MAELSNIFKKTEVKCSNIYLIDEILCLSKSLNLINSNVSNLSSAINQIQNTANHLNNVYTLFSNNSAAWFSANKNIKVNAETWNQNYTLVKNLSSSWNNPFVIYYTNIKEIQDWYVKEQTNTYSRGEILTWLNSNFPTSDYADYQVVNLYVNLYEDFSFDMTNFKSSFYHDCRVPKGNGSITCGFCPRPSHGCNKHGGRAGYGPCTNAYDECSVSIRGGGSVTFTCIGTGGSTIRLPSDGSTRSVNLIDRFLVRNIILKYQKQPNSSVWTFIP